MQEAASVKIPQNVMGRNLNWNSYEIQNLKKIIDEYKRKNSQSATFIQSCLHIICSVIEEPPFRSMFGEVSDSHAGDHR